MAFLILLRYMQTIVDPAEEAAPKETPTVDGGNAQRTE